MRKQWMLLIGISEYADPQVIKLPGVSVDVDLLRMCLEEHHAFSLGDRINDLRDAAATYTSILSSLERICANAGPEDQIMVFFAGHSISIPGGNAPSPVNGKTTYFLPSDAEVRALPAKSISTEDIAARLRNTKAQQVVLILDFCGSSGLTFGLPSLTSPELETRDWFVGATCRSSQFVADTVKGGLFIKPFCDALSGRVKRAQAYVSVDVKTAFEYASEHLRALMAKIKCPQQPRPVHGGNPIFLTTPPRLLVQHTWRNVLLLEDDPCYGRPIEQFLSENGYAVKWLQSPSALSLDELAQLPPDIAVVDLYFGADVHGLSTIHELRRKNSLLPILVITAHLGPELGMKAAKAGADDLLQKRGYPESEEFKGALLAAIDELNRKQRDCDIPNLQRKLGVIDARKLYTVILGPLYEKRGFVDLRYQNVPTRSGGTTSILCCLKDIGAGQSIAFGIYAVLGDIAVQDTFSGNTLRATALIDQLEDICNFTFTDIPPYGPTQLLRVILHSTGCVSSGARELIESAPSLFGKVAVFDNLGLIGMLKLEGLDHRLAYDLPKDKVRVYLSLSHPRPSSADSWMDFFYRRLQHVSRDCHLNPDQCHQKILNMEKVASGAGPSAVGNCHIYEPHLPLNILSITLITQLLPWSQWCMVGVKLGFLSILAGDETQEHAIQLRRVMQSLVMSYFRNPSHLERDAETVLAECKERLLSELVSKDFVVNFCDDISTEQSHKECEQK